MSKIPWLKKEVGHQDGGGSNVWIHYFPFCFYREQKCEVHDKKCKVHY